MNKDKKTLVILTPGFPENEGDSTCLPLQQNLIRAMIETDPQLSIIVLSFQYPYFKKQYKWFETTVFSFDGRNKGGLTRLLLRRKISATLKKITRTNQMKGLLSFWCGECALVGKRFADKHGLKHYCWVLGQDARKENKYVRRIKPKAGELIALSDFIQNEFEKNHDTRPQHLVPAAINPRQFQNASIKRDIDILGAGSLIPLKQYEIFLEIIAELKEQIPPVKAVLAGDGPEKKKLQDIIGKYKLESNVILAGKLPYPELLQLMQRTKIFLHPSSYEGFSCVCLEAIFAGAQAVGFCKTMQRNIEHWHIVNSKEEMKQKALNILQNPKSEYKRVPVFMIENIAQKMLDLYND